MKLREVRHRHTCSRPQWHHPNQLSNRSPPQRLHVMIVCIQLMMPPIQGSQQSKTVPCTISIWRCSRPKLFRRSHGPILHFTCLRRLGTVRGRDFRACWNSPMGWEEWKTEPWQEQATWSTPATSSSGSWSWPTRSAQPWHEAEAGSTWSWQPDSRSWPTSRPEQAPVPQQAAGAAGTTIVLGPDGQPWRGKKMRSTRLARTSASRPSNATGPVQLVEGRREQRRKRGPPSHGCRSRPGSWAGRMAARSQR